MHRQPVHTVYGGAHLFRPDTAGRLGATALRALDEHLGDPLTAVELFGLAPELASKLLARVRAKLEQEPVEDFRIDFEDGYGHRPDDEEDDERYYYGDDAYRECFEPSAVEEVLH